MPSEKFFVHKEDGSLVRLKGRLVRFLDEEPPTGSDKSAIRTALEVSPDAEGLVQADVGTGPQNLVLHQHLGTLAYADAESVSVAELQGDNIGLNASPTTARLTIADATNDCIHLTADESTIQGPYADTQIRMGGNIVVKGVNNAFLTTGSNTGLAVDSSGRVGIGNTSPGSYAINDLVVGNGAQDRGITIATASNKEGTISFADGTTGNEQYRGYVKYDHGGPDSLLFGTAGQTRWTINATGDLVSSGGAIDFGSGATLDDYEEGTWTPVIGPNSGSFSGGNTYVFFAKYTKVGNLVTANCYINTTSINTTGGSGAVVISGLPFSSPSASDYISVNVGYAYNWVNAPAGGYIPANTNRILLTTRKTSITGDLSGGDVSDLSAAASACNEIMLSVTYQTT